MYKSLLSLAFSYFLVFSLSYAQQVLVSDINGNLNSAQDVWVNGTINEFNNPATSPQYGNFEVKPVRYGNGFLKIGSGNARNINNQFVLGSCSVNATDGLVTYFDNENRHQWTAQLGYCKSTPTQQQSFGTTTRVIDVSSDEVGNVLVLFTTTVFRQFSGLNPNPAPITSASGNVIGNLHRTLPGYSSIASSATFTVPTGLTGNTYSQTYIAVVSQGNTNFPQIRVRRLSITSPNATSLSNLRIELDGRGTGGFYVSGSSSRDRDLQISNLNFPDPSPLTLPAVNDNTIANGTTFIVRYNNGGRPVWAKRILTNTIVGGASGQEGGVGNRNIDLVVDELGNPYMQIAHGVGAGTSTARSITADINNPNPSSTVFEVFGDIPGNGFDANDSFSLTRLDMITGDLVWTNSGTNYRIAANDNNSMNAKLAISNGNLYVLGEFGFAGNIFYPPHQTNLSSVGGVDQILIGEAFVSNTDRNLLLAGYDLSGNLNWARSATGGNERAYTVDVDREGNAYALVGYTNSLTMLPFSVASPQAGHALLKISSCGRLFWLENAFTSDNIYGNASMCFEDRDELYIGVRHATNTILRPDNTGVQSMLGLGGSEYIIRLEDTPILNCGSAGLTLITNTTPQNVRNWTDFCGSIGNANQTSLSIAPNTEGVYSIDSDANYPNPLDRNELWVSSNPTGADFDILGVSPVCTDAGYTYIVSNFQTNITYDWFLDGNPTPVATGGQYTVTWTNNTGTTITHTIVVRATDGNCVFERTFVVEVPPTAPEIVTSNFDLCKYNLPSSIQMNVTPPTSVPVGTPIRYSWTPTLGLSNPNVQNPTLDISQLPTNVAQFQYIVEVTLFDGTCVGRGVSTINITDPQVTLNIQPNSICNINPPIALAGGFPLGGTYSGIGVTDIFDASGNVIGQQFNPSGLRGIYEITYRYEENGCEAEAISTIYVSSRKGYTIQAFGCPNDPSSNPNPNPNENIGVALDPILAQGDRLTLTATDPSTGIVTSLTPQPITSGRYFDFTGIPIGSIITATITNSATGPCDVRTINGDETTTEFPVVEAPSQDIYVKDHPLDFGQQPSGGGYNSPSITITLQAPPTDADFTIPQNGRTIRYYYSDGTTQTGWNDVQNIVTQHRASLPTNQTSYIYIRVFNRCRAFGEGLQVDALVAESISMWGVVSRWIPLTQPVYIPRDIEAGGELVIAIPIDHTTLGLTGTYHTCSMARILRCTDEADVNCVPEVASFGPMHTSNTSLSNNKTWRNINVVSDAQGSSAVNIYNGDTTPKMVRVNFNFAENQDPTNAHYLENNDLVISMPETLAQRWQQNNYAKNNLAFIDNNHMTLRMPEQRDSWFEVLLMPEEKFRIGLEFTIGDITATTPLQEAIYYFDVTQENEGELVGGVGYEILIDLIDTPPASPSELNAQVQSSSEIQLNWVDNSDDELVFVLERKKAGDPSYVHVANINADDITYTDIGLEPYTFYQYRLKAISSTGVGLSSDYTYSSQVRTLDAAPAAPSNLVATLRSDCKVDLTWIDNASNDYRYEVVRILNGVSMTVATNISANSEYYLDNISITEANTYTYKVRTYSTTGLSSDDAEFALVIDPVSVSTLRGDAVSQIQIDLSWDAVSGATGYKLEKKVNGIWTLLGNLAASEVSFTDNTVSASTTYEYRLSVIGGCIISDFSELSVTTPAAMKKIFGYLHTGRFLGYNDIANEIGNIGGALVELVDANGIVLDYMTTGSNGYYEFEVAAGVPFTIRPSKDINKMNGVDQRDVTFEGWEKYFRAYRKGLNIYTIIPYDAIAADMDGDCDVDYDDYNLLQSAVYSTNTFPASSWQFVPSNYDFDTQGYCPYLKEREYVDGIIADVIDQNFIGVKVGDITEDSSPLMKVGSSTDLEDSPYPLALEVVPNPFVTSTQLLFGASTETSAQVSIYNSLGVEVYNKEIEVREGRNVHTLQLNVASGLYYVHIVGENISYTSKIIVEK